MSMPAGTRTLLLEQPVRSGITVNVLVTARHNGSDDHRGSGGFTVADGRLYGEHDEVQFAVFSAPTTLTVGGRGTFATPDMDNSDRTTITPS